MFCSLTKDVLFTVGELIKKRKSQDATLYKHYSIFCSPTCIYVHYYLAFVIDACFSYC